METKFSNFAETYDFVDPRLKEQRQAAFELATLATAGDDSKFRIVAEGG